MHPIKHVLPIQLCDNDPPFVFAYTTIKKFGISKTFFLCFEVSYTYQDCIYSNAVKYYYKSK